MGDIHEILFPRGSMERNPFFLFLFQGRAIQRIEQPLILDGSKIENKLFDTT
jgi:hypothetical protein